MKLDRCLRTSSPISVYVSALDFASRTWCPETCQDCGSADSVSLRPARIADQADYGPLHPARATRADLFAARVACVTPETARELTDKTGLYKAVEVRGIHHGPIIASAPRGDAAEISTEV
ncbi:hypothetical protein Prudu_019268 [Prunus dulcis]|uniref:Uncharacterized protein n=1 Tax=Prunus dulcis TaxID=3755 RepID=A0A4Y1RSL4_PRUDU|nr:hypothetical protein Prudu_019268 [Prunus dulcis]